MTPSRPDLPRIKAVMSKHGLDVLAASSPPNVYYLSELPVASTSPNALLYSVKNASPVFAVIPLDKEPALITTAAAVELARKHSWIKNIKPYKTGVYIVRKEEVSVYAANAFEAFSKLLDELGLRKSTIGVDTSLMPVGLVEKLKASIGEVKMVDATRVFTELRMVKNEEEIRRFREANRILCAAMKKVIGEMREGAVERDLHFILKTEILKQGGDGWFQTTIAAGPEDGPNIYHQPDGKKLRKGDIIRMDIGCVYQGFGCDLSRTVAVGTPPPEAKKIYSVLEEAEQLLIERAKPGVQASELHAVAEKYVREKLDPKYSRGNVGHGVGVELYDPPEISASDHTPLSPGMTLSLEVPYHKFGLSGFNIEDSVVITEKGNVVVSDLPRELIVV
ncbi:MAG: Xaa-Pro peptidase family protein [Candidatus Caldarchaeum sp.]|nr:Xaa-Pro peptidase family protein [Candidatus Caldarchaeum sp.]MDW7977280.1 Xaa-Pro peptidase family protein [Candidatus Caldarchaeum sp.]